MLLWERKESGLDRILGLSVKTLTEVILLPNSDGDQINQNDLVKNIYDLRNYYNNLLLMIFT